MGRRSINGHSRKRRNKRCAAMKMAASPMKYVTEDGAPLEGDTKRDMTVGDIAGKVGMRRTALSLGAKGAGIILGANPVGLAASAIGAGTAVAKAIKAKHQANIFEKGYTESDVGAMEL